MTMTMAPPTPSATQRYLDEAERFSARNYHPLPVVLDRGEGAWVWDVEGNRYLDMLASYSAVNQGHRHPRIIAAAEAQMEKLTLTSRAFHNDQMGPFLRELCDSVGFDAALPMNTGAEAVETADEGWHANGATRSRVVAGRTRRRSSSATGQLPRPHDDHHLVLRQKPNTAPNFGPMTPGFRIVEFGDMRPHSMQAITPNTVSVPGRAHPGRSRGDRAARRVHARRRRTVPRKERGAGGRRDPDRAGPHRAASSAATGRASVPTCSSSARRWAAASTRSRPPSPTSEFMDVFRPGRPRFHLWRQPAGARRSASRRCA